MSEIFINIPNSGSPSWKSPVDDTADLPAFGNNNGDARITLDTDTVYIWNGSAWIPVATPGAAIAIDGLIGDVSASGPGVVVATVNSVGGSSALNIHTAELAANAATSTNTPNTIVKRDGSGNFSAGTITANLIGNVSGNATTATTSVNFSGSLSGDITGTQSTTLIASNVVSNSKLAQMPTNTIKGNNTGITANVLDLTVTQVNTMLGDVTTIGTIDSQSASANGLVIAGNNIYAQSASATNPGLVNNTTQTFSGNKTFSGQTSISNTSTTALIVNTTSLVIDATNNAVGIGTTPASTAVLDIINNSGSNKAIQVTGYGSNVGFRGRRANGTLSVPSSILSGDTLTFFSGRGYGTSQFAVASTGAINIVAGENFTDTSNLTYLQFQTTPTGSVIASESMRIASTGITLGPQSSSTATHKISGGLAGTTRTVTAATLTVDTTTTDYIIYTDSTSNAITITLPTPTNGRILVIEDSTGTAATNNITINPHAAETINGLSNFIISQNRGSIRITSDGTNWFVQALQPNISVTIPPVVAISASAIDWSKANVFTKTLSANTTFTFSNITSGQTIVVRLTNTASNFTVTWPTVRWPSGTAPTMSPGAVSDVYTFINDGSNTYGSYVQNMT